MRIAGGVLAVIAGILSFFSTMLQAMFCNDKDLSFATHATMILGFGGKDAVIRSGLYCSVFVIVFGACMINSAARRMRYFLLAASIIGGILGGPVVAICMALALIGSFLPMLGKRSDIPPPL